MKFFIMVLGAFMFLTSTEKAKAQFLGDIFFETPSVSAVNGEELVLNLAAFTGAEIFGSTHLEISFDNSLFSITSVDFPNGISGESLSDTSGNITTLKIVAANGISLDEPTGVVTIADVRGTVSASPGTIINMGSVNKGMFLADRRDITNTSLGAEIIVTNSVSPLLLQDQPSTAILEVTSNDALYQRARRLAYDGSVVRLAQPNGSFTDVILLVDEE